MPAKLQYPDEYNRRRLWYHLGLHHARPVPLLHLPAGDQKVRSGDGLVAGGGRLHGLLPRGY